MKHYVCKRATGARRRGARVPGRERLRRGVRHAAAPARLAAQLDLGGLGQRVGARRAARARAGSPRRCPRSSPSASWRAAATRRSTPTSTGSRPRQPQDPEFEARSVVSDLAVALQASLLVRNAPGGGLRRVLRRAARRGRPRLRHAAGRRRHRGDPGARAARLNTLSYEVDGRDRAHHARPARARQRDHARDAARAGRVRGAGEPRPGRARDRARRQRQGLLRRLRPRRVRRDARRRTTTRQSPGTRSSTGR